MTTAVDGRTRQRATKPPRNINGHAAAVAGDFMHASLDAERMLLGSLVKWPENVIESSSVVASGMFVDPVNGKVFTALYSAARAAEREHRQFDVGEILPFIDGVCTIKDVIDLAEGLPSGGAWRMYADQVADKWSKRSSVMAGQQLQLDINSGMDAAEACRKLRERLDEIELGPAAGAAGRTLERMTSRELDHGEFHQRYLVEDVLPEGQGGIISGRFKTLKTHVGIDLLMSVTTATPFLGTFAVPAAVKAGIISAESGKASLQEAGRRVAVAKGMRLADCDGLIWSTSLPRIPRDLDLLESFIERDKLKLLLVDPSYLALADAGDSASNVFKMGDVLENFTRLTKQTGCSIILVNHNAKNRPRHLRPFDPPELSEISMSGFAEWARFWLLLGPSKEWSEATGEHWLWMRTGGSAGHAGMHALHITEGRRSEFETRRWAVDVTRATDARKDHEREQDNKRAEAQERKEQEHVAKLEKALRVNPAGETPRVLRDQSGLNGSSFATAIRTLLQLGKAELCEVKKHNQRFDGYRPK
jgi:hypothetical protein